MKNGLKGVTDATVFCKSMQKGGPAPMIRSYEPGGITGIQSPEMMSTESDSNCWPGRPGCAQSKGAKRRRARATKRRINQNRSRW